MPDYHDEVTRHRKPDWLKIKLHRSEEFGEVARIVREHGLHTICSSGMCPNQAECWSRRTARSRRRIPLTTSRNRRSRTRRV